jgi:nucleotide-binding universal stress UspA family protein
MPSAAPYRRILIATDFSDAAQRAFRHAVELARRMESELFVVHVARKLEPAVPWSRTNRAVVAQLRREAVGEARGALEALAEQAEDVKVTACLAEGVPHEEILAEARRRRAELVVVATRGRALSERLLLGSTAERVLRKSTVPVLVVPAPANRKPSSKRR